LLDSALPSAFELLLRLYLLHVLAGEIVLGQFPRIFHLDQIVVLKFGLVPVALIATTFAAVLSFRFFENPARRFFSDLHIGQIWKRVFSSAPIEPTRRAAGAASARSAAMRLDSPGSGPG